MSLVKEHKLKVKRQAWLEAIRLCGGVTAYSKRIKVLRSRVSNWINQPQIDIPFQFALTTWAMTQVSLDRLSPFTQSTNKIVRAFCAKRCFPVLLPLQPLILDRETFRYPGHSQQSVIIDTDRRLISGLRAYEGYQASKLKEAPLRVLDLKSWLLKREARIPMNMAFLMSERVAIGLRLEQILGHHRDWGSTREPVVREVDHTTSITGSHRIKEQQYQAEVQVAQLLGFSNIAYIQAKQVYQCGVFELIEALDRERLNFNQAAALASQSVSRQRQFFQANRDLKELNDHDAKNSDSQTGAI